VNSSPRNLLAVYPNGRFNRPFRMLSWAVAVGMLLGVGACSKDEDIPDPGPTYNLTTPEGAAAALRTLLADRDTLALADVLAPDAAFVLDPAEASDLEWPATLTSSELDRCLRNILAGTWPPEISQVTAETWIPAGPFAAADPGSPFPGSQEADYVVGLVVSRTGADELQTQGVIRLSVVSADDQYQIAGLQELAILGGNTSLGGFLVQYLANRPPVAVLAADSTAGDTQTTFQFDASQTEDPDESAGLMYSWGGDLTAGGWGEWTTTPVYSHNWPQEGTYWAKVRARDRWGLVGVDSLACTVSEGPLPFPDTPDKLIANFKTVYGEMDLTNYRDEILSPDYTFVLQAETVEEFGLPSNIFEYADEVEIAAKMFSGLPNQLGKVLTGIESQVLQPEGAWMPVAANDPYFGGFPGARVRNYSMLFYFNSQDAFRYEVRGNQMFYVTADTVMHNGVMTPRYKLLGQLDMTTILPAQRTEGVTWGTVKALWQ